MTLWSIVAVPLLIGALIGSAAARPAWPNPATPSTAPRGEVLVVGPAGPYRSIQEALAVARAGDTIEVRGGSYAGPLVVDRSVVLQGFDTPVLNGGGKGTVVTLAAAGAVLRGFVVRSSGTDLNAGDAGVEVRAANVVVEDNRLEDVLNGISLDDAAGSVVRHNRVRGKALPAAARGDGLRIWYSAGVLIEGNQIEATRDSVIWYSPNVRLIGNRIERGRYGLHFMYDDGAELVENVLRDNSVGAYLMYSNAVTLRGNLLAASRGPSGFGLGLKDVDNVVAESNWLIDNRVGIWLDNSPRSLDATSRFHGNVFAFNDIGLTLQPAIERNTFWDNTFRENRQQVSVQGGGRLHGNQWAEHGRGNYWSDYRGFDANGDGVGDVPYRAEALFDELMDRRPQMRFFQFGLAAGLIEFAARAFPLLRPAPKLVDEAPLVAPPPIPAPPGQAPGNPWPFLGVSLGLLGLAGSISTFLFPASGRGRERPLAPTDPPQPIGPALAVARLTKRFGRLVAVDGLDLSVAPGEAVALWGPNGAGKTTALKCILGLLPCTGEVMIAGRDALRHGKEARQALGYVPQEVAFHDDLTVAETVAFYGRLKRVPPTRADELLALVGLAEHTRKPVGTLSGGLRQRLALAVALLTDPPLLLLDEPTSNLDAAGRDRTLRLLKALQHHGTAILFASHRFEEVEAIADRVLVLDRGRATFACPPRELAHRLGLRQRLSLRLAPEDREAALLVLRGAGLTLHPNGATVGVDVLPNDKALPIRLLERAGIAVADFAVEDDVARHGAEEAI